MLSTIVLVIICAIIVAGLVAPMLNAKRTKE
jgi:hypothetical protein